MPRTIHRDEFNARLDALRQTDGNVAEAKRQLDAGGYPVAYEALRSFAKQHRGLLGGMRMPAEQAVVRILRVTDGVKANATAEDLRRALGEVRRIAALAGGEP